MQAITSHTASRVLKRVPLQKVFLLHRDHSKPAFFSDAFGIDLYISRFLTSLLLSRNSHRREETRATPGIVSRWQPWRSTFYSGVPFFESLLVSPRHLASLTDAVILRRIATPDAISFIIWTRCRVSCYPSTDIILPWVIVSDYNAAMWNRIITASLFATFGNNMNVKKMYISENIAIESVTQKLCKQELLKIKLIPSQISNINITL